MPDPADDKDKGGQGGEGGEPKPIGEEDIGRMVNAAVTSQLGRHLPKALEGLKLDEKIAEAFAKYAPKPPEGDPEAKTGQITKSDLEKQIQKLQEKVDSADKARIASEQRTAEVEMTSKRTAAKSALRASLAPKMRPELVDDFVDLIEARGRLKIGEDGSALLKVRRAPYKGMPEEDQDLPLEEALPVLLASKEVSPYLPAPGGQQGSGTTAQRQAVQHVTASGGDNSEMAKLNRVAERFQKLGIPDDVF